MSDFGVDPENDQRSARRHVELLRMDDHDGGQPMRWGSPGKVAHRVVFMDHGRIVEDATKEEFFGTPPLRTRSTFLSKILSH